MATHSSYILENDTGANFRTDLNNFILALRTSNSSATEPVNPVAGMFWVDTSASPVLLKLRDSTNSLWTTIYDITNDRGIIASTATNATSINGVAASDTAGTINSIYKNLAVSGIRNDVIGDASGYALTVQTNTLANILDISARTHKNMVLTGNSAPYSVTAADMSTQASTTGFEQIMSYVTPFSGSITIQWYAAFIGGIAQNYYVALNTVNISGTLSTVASGTGATLSLDADVAEGDTISIYATLRGETGFDRTNFQLGLASNEFGNYAPRNL